MKKLKIKTVSALSLSALLLCLTSCEKSDLKPHNAAGVSSLQTGQTLRTPTYEAGIRSNEDYPANQEVNTGYYITYSISGPGLQTPFHDYFGGDVGTSPKAYGFAINPSTGTPATAYAYKISGIPVLNYNGTELPIMRDLSNYFTYAIEEIEIYPTTLEVYALCNAGKGIVVYKIDPTTGLATAVPTTTTTAVFAQPALNGYQSGSICFVPDGSGGFKLAFSYESTSTSSSGLVVDVYTVGATTLSYASTQTYDATSGLPFSSAHINTAWGDGAFYFGRDADSLYSVDFTLGTNAPFTAVSAANLSNDYGYWKNF